MKQIIRDNKIVIIIVSAIFFVQIYYLSVATHPVPIMDYWRYLGEIGEKTFTGSLDFADFWKASAGVHRNPLLYLIFIINIKIFNWNTQIEIFAGAFIMTITCFVLYHEYKKIIIEPEKKYVRQMLFFPIALAIFNFNQWEMLTLEYSFVFMVRILVFCMIFISIDDFLHHMEQKKTKLVGIGVLISLVICTLSQGYFPAMVLTVVVALVFHFICQFKDERRTYLIYYVLTCMFIIIGAAIYLIGLPMSSDNGNSLKLFLHSIINGDLIKGIFVMLGSSLVHLGMAKRFGGIAFFIGIGFALFSISVLAVVIYFKQRMYRCTYIPIMLIIYSITNMLMIFYARANAFNLEYLSSSRYVCETTLGLVGVIWVLITCILQFPNIHKSNAHKVLPSITMVFIIFTLLSACFSEMYVAPYRKNYGQELIPVMQNIDNATDVELAPFQAGDPNLVRGGVKIMEKYKLGIFKGTTDGIYSKKTEIGSSLERAKILSGYYTDGWLGKSAEFKIQTGEEGKVILTGYYPNDITGQETGTIFIDGKENHFKITEANFTLELSANVESIVTVKIENDFTFQATAPDIRQLSFILSDAQGR